MAKNNYMYYKIYKIWNQHHPDDLIQKGDGYHIHHMDENPKNNNINNLQKIKAFNHLSLHNKGKIINKEWREKISKANKGKIRSEESKNKYSKANKGENNPSSKLTQMTVDWIRDILNSDEYKKAKKKHLISQSKLANLFGVKQQIISKIKNNKRWEK